MIVDTRLAVTDSYVNKNLLAIPQLIDQDQNTKAARLIQSSAAKDTLRTRNLV